MSDRTVIAQISDLHCGSRYHIPSLATRVVDELNSLDPDVVVVTGDLTDMGFRGEFRQAHRMLERIACERSVVLIGNHDARNVGDVHFEELFGRRRVEIEPPGMRLIGLDSSEPDLDSGRIGRDTHHWLAERFALDEWKDGKWAEFAKGTSIGNRRLLRLPSVTTEKVRVRLSGPVCPAIAEVALYAEPTAH